MPGGDRTGPMGMGPMTGRGAGFCAGSRAPGYLSAGLGRGWFGRGRGGGRGWRNWLLAGGMTGWQQAAMAGLGLAATSFFGDRRSAPPAEQPGPDALEALRQQAEHISAALDEINQRIDRLEKQSQQEA
jgi:hypothetical protein